MISIPPHDTPRYTPDEPEEEEERMTAAYDLVVVGTSWGGLRALETILKELPASFALPLVVVQHRQAGSDDTLARLLGAVTSLPVAEAEDKALLEAGHVYVAPADYHLMIESTTFVGPRTKIGRPSLALTVDAPVGFSRPSIDVLFQSAADAIGRRLIGIILTGANSDGAEGLMSIRDVGGMTIAQDPASSESPAMPRAAIARGGAVLVLALEKIAPLLVQLQSGMARPAIH